MPTIYIARCKSLSERKKGTPFPRCPSVLEQPHDDGYHRGQIRMHKASETKTVRRTVRLAGLEKQKETHAGSPFPRARGPNVADIAR
jgi:hypothetical protein